MTPDRWEQIKAALDEAMALDGEARARYVERVSAGDLDLRRELESLLAADLEAGSRFLETPAPASLGADTLRVGARLGAYRLLAEIGAGGMGDVYRAVRADDEYQREVAIKIVRAGPDPAFVADRLRAERQILASLDHPHIGRLLDGGTSDGLPYLVMELIEGRPITAHCDERRLDTTRRLELFLLVCSAVQYAHQHMVIHRDLKPSNILVTAEGAPKLLDFGIAKILDPDAVQASADATIGAHRVLTPQYASPEQLRGEPVTAASDVYSLGVVLHELLTGSRPRRDAERPAPGAPDVPASREPRRPSTVLRPAARFRQRGPADAALDAISASRATSPARLRRRLQGDLDNIVSMALRAEPQRRYATVEQFAADIRRHLNRLPVAARRPTFRYRAVAFISRHAAAVAASSVVALALIGGFAMTVRETLIANAQRARAERRFDDVRRLANALIFDIHDSIRDLPGAAQSRRVLVRTARQYLDSLSHAAAGDPVLQRDLATAYLRLGDLQGHPSAGDASDYAGALASYRMALRLIRAQRAAKPGDETLVPLETRAKQGIAGANAALAAAARRSQEMR